MTEEVDTLSPLLEMFDSLDTHIKAEAVGVVRKLSGRKGTINFKRIEESSCN